MDNYHRALPLLSLSGIYLEQDRAEDAESVSREALDLLKVALPEGHAITAVAQCRVARSLAARGRPTEAAPYFDLAVATLVKGAGPLKYRRECLAEAAASFASLGDQRRAEELRATVRGLEGL